MLKSILTPALIALSLAGAAHAAQPAGDAQLANLAGVPAGQYTAAELQAILTARDDHDISALNYYLSGANRSTGPVADVSGQLSSTAGVEPGAYSAAELSLIINGRNANDRDQVAYVLSGTNRVAPASAESVSAGKAQLAAALNLDPAQYTLAQLSALWAAAND